MMKSRAGTLLDSFVSWMLALFIFVLGAAILGLLTASLVNATLDWYNIEYPELSAIQGLGIWAVFGTFRLLTFFLP